MTTNRDQASYDDIANRLRETKRKAVLVCLGESAARVWIAFVACAAIALGLDALFDLPITGRFVLGGLVIVTFLALAVCLALVPIVRAFRLTERRLSLIAEQHFPNVESRIVTILSLYPQLQRALTETEKGFLSLAIRSAHTDTTGADFRKAIPARRMKRLSGGGGMLLAAGLAFAVLSPEAFMSAIKRFTGLMQEYREAHAQVSLSVEVVETDTVHVFRTGGEVRVAAIRGSDVRVEVQAVTNVEIPLYLHSRAAGQEEFSVRTLNLAETSLVAVPNVSRDTELYFRLGPERTGTIQVRATDYPKVTNAQLRFVFPDYTMVRPQFIPATDGKIRALYMTKAEVSIQADKPLRRGTFSIYEQQRDGKVYGRRTSITFLVTRSGPYGAEIVDRDGFACQTRFEQLIECLPDQAPVIEVQTPAEVLVSQAGAKGVAVRFRAQDDYGIDMIRLVYEVGSLPGVRIGKERSEGPRKREKKIDPRRVVNMTLPCRFEELGLEVGEVVTCHVEVDDTDTESGPHTAKSESMRVVVVGRELQDWIEIEDEDRWPTDFVGFAGGKRATGLGEPGVSKLVTDASEKANEESAGVTNAVEGFVPHQLRQSFSDYSNSLKDQR